MEISAGKAGQATATGAAESTARRDAAASDFEDLDQSIRVAEPARLQGAHPRESLMSFSLRKASELVRLNSPLRMRVPADDVGPLRTDTSLHGDAAARMTASLQLESPSAPLEAARTRNDCLPRPTPATAEIDDNR